MDDFPDAHPDVAIPPDDAVSPFCSPCAERIRELVVDLSAEPRADPATASCVRGDEIPRGWCRSCLGTIRWLLAVRSDLMIGAFVSADARATWDRFAVEFPDWPFFRPDRRSPEAALEAIRLLAEAKPRWEYDRMRRKALDREQALAAIREWRRSRDAGRLSRPPPEGS